MANFFIPENKGTDPAGRFLDRNTNAGIYGAVIYAMILNQLGDESEALVKAAGLTPSSEDNTQWLQAIRKLYGDADTALKEELISKIEALTASDIAFDDSIKLGASNIQEAILKIIQNRIYPIGSYYIQFPEPNGAFNTNKSPENLFGGTWTLSYNNQGVFLRTEGGNANEGRREGIQSDAIRNIAGHARWFFAQTFNAAGVFRSTYIGRTFFNVPFTSQDAGVKDYSIVFDASNIVQTGSENRPRNILIRIWLRIA